MITKLGKELVKTAYYKNNHMGYILDLYNHLVKNSIDPIEARKLVEQYSKSWNNNTLPQVASFSDELPWQYKKIFLYPHSLEHAVETHTNSKFSKGIGSGRHFVTGEDWEKAVYDSLKDGEVYTGWSVKDPKANYTKVYNEIANNNLTPKQRDQKLGENLNAYIMQKRTTPDADGDYVISFMEPEWKNKTGSHLVTTYPVQGSTMLNELATNPRFRPANGNNPKLVGGGKQEYTPLTEFNHLEDDELLDIITKAKLLNTSKNYY